ncbi:S8 family serine peptidase [Marinicella rhabdoformis]|uniref:S8 family serine peptidase n=1 Tax=Marinicella rhabdoformis TaxID=2580566 RepID=UPI0015D05687|nr:S8 family serine peptidase [Marinicella rhabdoformis]
MKLKPLVAATMLFTGSATLANLPTLASQQPDPQSIKQAINNNQLILATGIFDPKNQALNFQAVGLESIASKNYGIVQFNIGKANAQWLKQQGFEVIQSLPSNAFVVNWKNKDQNVLSANSDIRWHGAFQSGYKVSPSLWQQNRASLTSYTLVIHAFKDYPRSKMEALIKKMVPSATLATSNIPASDNRIAISIPSQNFDSSINRLSLAEGIQWINRYYPERFLNDDAVQAVQDNSSSPIDRSIFAQGIYGTGQIVGIADSGLDRNEDWFAHLDKGNGVVSALTDAEASSPPFVGNMNHNNKVIAYWVMPGATAYDEGTYHGTHVSGSVAGDKLSNGSGSIASPTQSGYDTDDGMAPNAQILFQDIGSNSGLTGVGSSPMWQQAHDAGAYIHSNSYGSDSRGEYGGSDQNLDRTLRNLENMIIAVAAGNDAYVANSTGSPGNAKNAITVGALNHGNSATIAGYSNYGLTDDGRLKPDIATTGTSIVSAAGDSNNGSTIDTNPSSRSTSGTSMATPITAGAMALLRQYFVDGFYPTGVKNAADSIKPSGPLMKAMLLNGSNADAGFNYNRTGWGRPSLNNTLHFDGDNRKIKFWDVTHENGLGNDESVTFDVDVLSGEEFRATLTWYDLPGPTGSGVTLVNNLNLSIVAPDGTYLGNNFNTANSAVSQTGGSADNINTVEQVRLTAPQTGTYEITVTGADIPGDGTFGSDKQGYALVVSGALGSVSPQNLGDPSNLMGAANGLSGNDLNWTAATNADFYEVYRATGTCQNIQSGSMRFIGQTGSESFTDADTVGGYDYAYQVRAFNSDYESNYTSCVDVTSAQACLLPPQFSATETAITSNVNDSCSIGLSWPAASSSCPADPSVSYNIYRSTSHNFTANGGTLLTTVNNMTQHDDLTVTGGQAYFYRVEALNNGNTSSLSPELASTAIGTASNTIGTLSDNIDDSLLMNATGTWSVSNDRASDGTLSYRSTFEGASTYTSNTCARIYSPELSIPNSGSPSVDYQAWYEIEAQWDGVVVEVSNDGGSTWTDLPPVGGYPSDFSQTGSPAINVCGYPASQGAYGGNSTGFDPFSHDLTAYQGDTVQIRWSFSTDPASQFEGFYIDQINYNNVYTPNVCGAVDLDLIFKHGFEQ